MRGFIGAGGSSNRICTHGDIENALEHLCIPKLFSKIFIHNQCVEIYVPEDRVEEVKHYIMPRSSVTIRIVVKKMEK